MAALSVCDRDGRLLEAQLVGQRSAGIAKRVDTYATALHHGMTIGQIGDLDHFYTAPLGCVWHAVQVATQVRNREMRALTTQP